MQTPSLLPKRLSSVSDDDDTLRTVVFSLANMENTSISQYIFALPVEAVDRAIVYPSERAVLRDGIGMLNLGDRTLTIVDLRQKFTPIDPQQDSSKFLILFHTQAGELCGLPVKDAPVLLDIDPDTIRSIPLAYREVNQLSFVSHMAIVPQENGLEPLQILILGLDRPPGQSASTTSHLN
ncbi:chemotaxis protein CheW [Chamaesiphon sp. VAR_48_metabat_403]|uniref:chemotaxis protein CheW n=1 Tax=Chamaesiphon sp. VAR_48_metabat_403 TaxID=2964700 RepID=UPI00286DCF78|nr:chemotaxis protein CheW [Chamaesiphon sp. VAR_48_metabat_403]